MSSINPFNVSYKPYKPVSFGKNPVEKQEKIESTFSDFNNVDSPINHGLCKDVAVFSTSTPKQVNDKVNNTWGKANIDYNYDMKSTSIVRLYRSKGLFGSIEMPDMPKDEKERLASNIIEPVKQFNIKTIYDLRGNEPAANTEKRLLTANRKNNPDSKAIEYSSIDYAKMNEEQKDNLATNIATRLYTTNDKILIHYNENNPEDNSLETNIEKKYNELKEAKKNPT